MNTWAEQPVTADLTSSQHAMARVERPATEHARLSVVVPVYNEREVLPMMYQELKRVMDELGSPYELVFVNDGSDDGTRLLLESLCGLDRSIKLLNFSRNFGHQAAIRAGMDCAVGDAVIVIDADLQDPPAVIPLLVSRWQDGYEVVHAKRTRRLGETAFKRWSAALFYRALNRVTDVAIEPDVGDFRLLDRKVCTVLKHLPEQQPFVRGLVAWAGFHHTTVEYVRAARPVGETKYTLPKMLKLSGNAVTAFSGRLLRLPLYLGESLLVLTLAFGIYAAVWSLTGRPGLPSTAYIAALLVGMNAVVLTGMGVQGLYLARIVEETRRRPLYVIDSRAGFDEEAPHGSR